MAHLYSNCCNGLPSDPLWWALCSSSLLLSVAHKVLAALTSTADSHLQHTWFLFLPLVVAIPSLGMLLFHVASRLDSFTCKSHLLHDSYPTYLISDCKHIPPPGPLTLLCSSSLPHFHDVAFAGWSCSRGWSELIRRTQTHWGQKSCPALVTDVPQRS